MKSEQSQRFGKTTAVFSNTDAKISYSTTLFIVTGGFSKNGRITYELTAESRSPFGEKLLPANIKLTELSIKHHSTLCLLRIQYFIR